MSQLPSIRISINKIIDQYVCKLDVGSIKPQSSNKPEFIVILDSSGSMSTQTERISSKILPQVFTQLGYSANDKHHIIDFNSNTFYQFMSSNDLIRNPIKYRGN